MGPKVPFTKPLAARVVVLALFFDVTTATTPRGYCFGFRWFLDWHAPPNLIAAQCLIPRVNSFHATNEKPPASNLHHVSIKQLWQWSPPVRACELCHLARLPGIAIISEVDRTNSFGFSNLYPVQFVAMATKLINFAIHWLNIQHVQPLRPKYSRQN